MASAPRPASASPASTGLARAALLSALALVPSLSGALACGSSSTTVAATPQDDGGADAPEASGCQAGDVLVGGLCRPLLADSATCKPGTRAALGSASCVPVGTTSCAAGFTAHASGWGCVPVLPAAACAGATRDALGSTTCVPVGDCNAPFPPAGATIFVDASLADGQVDATHFKTLSAALAAAPAKATVAVAPGTYAESIVISKQVTLAGQCAEKVILDAPAGAPAVEVSSDATVAGLTVRGGSGVDVGPPAHLSLADVVLDQNVAAGITATDGAVVSVARSVIRGTRTASASGTTNGVFVDVNGKVTLDESVISGAADAGIGATGHGIIMLHRSVVRDTVKRADGVGGAGARVFEGAQITLDESAIAASIGSGVLVGMTKGGITLTRSSVVGTKPDLRAPGGTASAANVDKTGTLDATESTFADNAISGVDVDHVGSRATLTNCVVVGTTSGSEFGIASSTSAANGAVLEIKSCALIGGFGTANYALHAGSTITMDSSLVSDVGLSTGAPMLTKGHGGTALSVVDAARATLTGSTMQGCHELAIGIINAGSTLVLDHTLVSHTLPNGGGLFGHGIMGEDKAMVTLRHSVVEHASGIGLAFSGATASIQGSFVRDNAVGIHAQDGSTLMTGAAAPQTASPLVIFVTDDTQFEGNATRVGSGELPLPTVIAPTTP